MIYCNFIVYFSLSTRISKLTYTLRYSFILRLCRLFTKNNRKEKILNIYQKILVVGTSLIL